MPGVREGKEGNGYGYKEVTQGRLVAVIQSTNLVVVGVILSYAR